LDAPTALAEHFAETVRVTAPRIDRTLPDLETARIRIQQTPGGVDVIDAERIRDGRVSTLADALRGSPGVFAESRFGAEEARISIRGSGLQRTFHGRGLLLLQDGVPLNLADGGFDMQAIEPLATRYVEVYRGANATPFGATTLGGAINFVSLSGREAPGVHARVEAGSYGYSRASAGIGFAWGDTDAFISGSQFFQRGYRDHAEQNTQRVSANLGHDFGGGMRTRFFFASVNTESELPGSLTRNQFRADPRQANLANVTGDHKRDFQLWRLSNRTTWQMSAATDLELVTYGSVKQLSHPIFQVIDQDSTDYGMQLRLGHNGHLLGRPNRLLVGALANRGFVNDRAFLNMRGRRGDLTGNQTLDSDNLGLFAENHWQATGALTLVAGGHWTRSVRERRDFFLADAAPADDSIRLSFDRISPRLGARYAFGEDAEVFANWSGSFEPPSLSESSNVLGSGATAALLANRAQRGQTLEIGTRGHAHSGNHQIGWDLALYRAELRNELLAIGLPNQPASSATVNANRTIHQGVEAGIRVIRGPWTWSTTATLNDFRFDGDADYGDNRIAGLPKAFGISELRWNGADHWYIAPALQAATRSWIDHANTLDAPGYALVNLRIGQRPQHGWGWFVEGRNLLDREHIVTTGVLRDARIPPPGPAGTQHAQFLPGDGITVYAGLEYRPKP
jgi:iron complex outermembrane receptor protein